MITIKKNQIQLAEDVMLHSTKAMRYDPNNYYNGTEVMLGAWTLTNWLNNPFAKLVAIGNGKFSLGFSDRLWYEFESTTKL